MTILPMLTYALQFVSEVKYEVITILPVLTNALLFVSEVKYEVITILPVLTISMVSLWMRHAPFGYLWRQKKIYVILQKKLQCKGVGTMIRTICGNPMFMYINCVRWPKRTQSTVEISSPRKYFLSPSSSDIDFKSWNIVQI